MKTLTAIILMVPLSGGLLWAVDNPNVRSPVGSPTAVPSASRSGLVPSRPYDASGADNIVTGTVGGLRQFRGGLPYNASYYSGATAYSPVDDFLRRSYDPIVHDRWPGLSRPYYDPRRLATSTVRADGSGMFSPTITSQGQSDPFMPLMLPQTLDTQYRQRPLSLSGSEMERLMARQLQLRQEAEQQRSTLTEEERGVIQDVRTETPFFQDYLRSEEVTPVRDQPADSGDREVSEPPMEEQALEAIREEYARIIMEESLRRNGERPRPFADVLPADTDEQPDDQDPEQTASQRAQAAALLKQHGDFARLARARADEYVAAAENFLKAGQFYRAADAFALAAIWEPGDVRPFVGQSVSLFAAGEYMSSAFLLRQAILKNPKVASETIDVSALIGDRDVYEQRLIEMATWQQRSGSGELAFLIAYLMHHDGKSRAAAEAIAVAAEQMPDDKAVQTLRGVIVPTTN